MLITVNWPTPLPLDKLLRLNKKKKNFKIQFLTTAMTADTANIENRTQDRAVSVGSGAMPWQKAPVVLKVIESLPPACKYGLSSYIYILRN